MVRIKKITAFLAILLASAGYSLTADSSETSEKRGEIIETLAELLEDNFVFADVGAEYARHLRNQLQNGAYNDGNDESFANQVTRELQKIHPDGHLRVRQATQSRSAPRPDSSGLPRQRPRAIDHSEQLTPDIAYIRFNGFPGDPDTLARITEFIAENAHIETLIIDARGHRGGGLGEMDVLFQELYSKETILVNMDTRKAVEEARGAGPDIPTLRQIPSPDSVVRREHVAIPSADPLMGQTNVYLLTALFTASAGEHLALALKSSGRARLIGETTVGAGHYGGNMPLGSGFSAFIPVGRTFDPETGEDWEGTGVEPHIVVDASLALITALMEAGLSKDEAEAIDTRLDYTVPTRPRRSQGT